MPLAGGRPWSVKLVERGSALVTIVAGDFAREQPVLKLHAITSVVHDEWDAGA